MFPSGSSARRCIPTAKSWSPPRRGLTRTGPGPVESGWGGRTISSEQAHKSRRHLGVETIDLWQLHRIDPKVPRDEQFGAIKSLIDAKVIRFAGLSEVSVAEIEAAAKVFPVATVQNRYNLADRASEDVLELLREARDRLHSLVSARRRRTRQARRLARADRARPSRDARPDRPRLASQAQPRHAADSRHVESRASRGERRRRRKLR